MLRDRLLLLLLIAAIIIRVGYLWYYSTLPQWDQLTVDNYYHHHWAQDIAGGDIFGDTTYFRAPFYVYCLGLLYAIFGDGLWVGRLFGVAVGAVSVLLTFLIGRRIFGRNAGLIAAALHAIYPIAIYFDGELLLDSLFTLLLEASLYSFLTWWDDRTLKKALVAGLFVGLATITRPTMLVLVPFGILAMLIGTGAGLSDRIKQTAAFAVGMIICILPITVRNIAVADDAVLIASQGGINLYIGNNPSADGFSAILPEPLGANWRLRDIAFTAEQEMGRPLKPGDISGYWNSRATDWIAADPIAAAKLYLRKLYYSFGNREISNNRDLSRFFGLVPYFKYHPLSFALIFGFGLVGAVLYSSNVRIRMIVITILLFTATNALFFVNSRFRLPLVPLFLVLAAVACVKLVRMLWQEPLKAALPASLLVAAALFSYFPLVSYPQGANVQGYISEALYHHVEGDYEQSIRLLYEAERRDPSYPEIHLNLGAAFFRRGQTDSARFHFLRETELHPKRAKAYVNLASFALVSGNIQDARRTLAQAIDLQPYDVTANLLALRIAAADTSLETEDVRQTVETAIHRSDSDLQVIQEAARLLQSKGELLASEPLLRATLTMEPPPIETDDAAFDRVFPHSSVEWNRRLAQSHHLLGYLFGVSARYDSAIYHSQKAIELDSTFADAYVNLISGYLSQGNSQAAADVLSTAVARFPRHDRLQRLASMLQQR